GHHRPDALQHAQGGALVGRTDHLADDHRQDQRAQALPEVADSDPVEGEDDEGDVSQPAGPGRRRRGRRHVLFGVSVGPNGPRPGMWRPMFITTGARWDAASCGASRSRVVDWSWLMMATSPSLSPPGLAASAFRVACWLPSRTADVKALPPS